jgi:hypothetical protein
MHYLVSVIADGTEVAIPGEMAAINAFTDNRLKAEGRWVFAGGLASPNSFDSRKGPSVNTGSPSRLSTTVAVLDVALKLAAEGSMACNRKIEVRPFQGIA